MESDPDELARLIAALPRKQQLDLVVAVLSRIALSVDSTPSRPSPTGSGSASIPPWSQLRQGLGALTAPDAALVAALAFVSSKAHPDVQFGTEDLNELIGDARISRLNVQALNPLCVEHYLTAVASTASGRKRFKFTPLGLEKAKLVAREILEDED